MGLEKDNAVDLVFPPRADGSLRKLGESSDLNRVFNITGYLYQFLYQKLGVQQL